MFMRLSAGVYYLLQVYAPANRLLRWMRTREGAKWGAPIALLAVPAYVLMADVLLTFIDNGGSPWLGIVVWLCLWNIMRFTLMGVWCLLRLSSQGVSSLGRLGRSRYSEASPRTTGRSRSVAASTQ